MEPSTRTILKKARETLEDPARWTKGCSARDDTGTALDASWDPSAVSWCLTGAIWSHSHALYPEDSHLARVTAHDAMHAIRAVTPMEEDRLSEFNDHPNTTHRHILQILDHTIDCLPEEHMT